jgi:hypothetical protein
MAKSHSTRTSRVTARIPPFWLAAVGLVVSVTSMWQPGTLALANSVQRLALNLPTWLLFGLAASAVTMSLAIVAVLLRTRHRKEPDEFIPQPPRIMRMSIVTLVALLLLLGVFIAGGVGALHLLNVDLLGLLPLLRAPPTVQPVAPPRDTISVPAFEFVVTVTLGTVAVVITAFALLVIMLNQPWAIAAEWLSRSHERKNATLAVGLTSAMSTGIHELEAGADPRSAVIACYRRCEATLASHRRRRHASETPREFVHEAFAALKLPAPAVQALLQVFEKARFSELPVTPSDRSTALCSLGEIRSTLARRHEDGA